jgi:hypothetical protein
MQGSGVHCQEAFGTAVSIIVAAYIPVSCKPCFIQEVDESTSGNPFLANSLECTCSNSFLFSSLEKAVVQL